MIRLDDVSLYNLVETEVMNVQRFLTEYRQREQPEDREATLAWASASLELATLGVFELRYRSMEAVDARV